DILAQTALAIINWLHLLATVVWIGGMAVNILVLMPSVREGLEPSAAGRFMPLVMKRFRILVYASIIVLVATGVSMMLFSRSYLGPLQLDNAWSQVLLVKHIFVAVLILIAVYAFEVLAPKVTRIAAKGPSPELAGLQKLQVRLATTGLLVGIVILLLTGIATSITALA
ncbi:MAG: CopD family protein, partial [Nitrososphaerales archaeon]